MSEATARILYCNCTYAKVIPRETKREVLRQLSASGVAFDTVADLCDMSARKDPALARYAATENLKIVACFPRAVRWLFHAAGAPLDEQQAEVLNMRQQTSSEIVPLMVNGRVRLKEGAA